MHSKDQMTVNQAIFTLILFFFGSSVILGISTKVAQDSWAAILIGALIALPVLLMYAQILRRYPGKDLFEIADILLGKKAGAVIAVLYTWYALHLGALVLRNFSDFIQISLLPETPQLPITILMILTSIYLTRSGMRAIGKWSVAIIFYIIFVIVFTFTAAMRLVHLDELFPLLQHPPREILDAGVGIASFPFAESVILLCAGKAVPKGKSRKVYLIPLLFTTAVFLLAFVRNISLLGQKMFEVSLFPSYVTARIIQLGNFITRIEGSISSNFVMTGLVKISLCLTAGARGISRLAGLPDYKTMVMPAGMFVFMLTVILFDNTMDMFHFIEYYPVYAFPFQVLVPFLIFFVAEVEARHAKKRQPA